jgi:hypothetical protein
MANIKQIARTFHITIVATIIYVAFAVYLYRPQFKKFDTVQYLLIVNISLACLGCFVLSRRWIAAFTGSFFAGAMYGFGAFFLGLAKFHPAAGLLAAGVPWLFCPASFVVRTRWRWLGLPLSVLPFLAILFFFRVSEHYHLFAVPISTKLHFADLAGLVAPLVMAQRSGTLVGFYHVPAAALVMGFAILVTSRKLGIIVILCLGTILAFRESFYGISPVIWFSIPVLCGSVLIGIGMQGLASAGYTDRRWVLLAGVVSGLLAIVTLLLATKYFQVFAGLGGNAARLFIESAKMYILGAVMVAVIFFMARSKLRFSVIRWILLCSAMVIDIFFSARFIVDKLF